MSPRRRGYNTASETFDAQIADLSVPTRPVVRSPIDYVIVPGIMVPPNHEQSSEGQIYILWINDHAMQPQSYVPLTSQS